MGVLVDTNILLKKNLSPDINRLLEQIGSKASQAGVDVFLVGGIVRDLLLGYPNGDIDLVVEGAGVQFALTLAKSLGGEVTSHESFGTAAWQVTSELKIDLATARREYYQYPAALPTAEYATLKEDLYRRDFTVNAMAIQLNSGQPRLLVDYFHGWQDLREKKIKIMHNLSFVEDPTRIFRAVRFEERLGLQMDEHTLDLALKAVHNLIKVSEHRLAAEWRKLFNEANPVGAIERLDSLGVWDYLFSGRAVAQSNMVLLNRLKKLADRLRLNGNQLHLPNLWVCYLAGLLFTPFREELGAEKQPDLVEKLREYLTKKELNIIKEIAELSNFWAQLEHNQCFWVGCFHKELKKFSAEAIIFMTAARPADLEDQIVFYLIEREKIVIPITGTDLMNLGLQPGPIYTEVFQELETVLLNREVKNKEEAICWVKDYTVNKALN